MQIKEISKNRLEIVFNLSDLSKLNIDFHSFMCNSFQNYNVISKILNFANTNINYSINYSRYKLEIIFVSSENYFIIIATHIPKVKYLHISNKKYIKLINSNYFFIRFNSFNDFCMFSTYIGGSFKVISSLYLFNKSYFLYIKINHIKNLYKLLALSYEFTSDIYVNNYILDENAEIIIKNNAIQTSINYLK